MKCIYLLKAFLFISILSFSQTKRIAHRSHSGSDMSFNIASYTDNFGLPVPDSVKKKPVKKRTIKTKVLSKDTTAVKDSIKQIPLKSSGTDKQIATRREVYAVLSEMMDICTK
jgi:hypothetical protein